MTDVDREIKRLISYIRSCREANIDCTVTIDKRLTHCVLNALEEVQKYREIGTVEECREAVEKQSPKKPKEILRHRGGFELRHCPNCNTDYEVDVRYTITDGYCPKCGKLLDSAFRHYCGNCGQAIDENLEGMEE